jgi:hypothetical protein
MRPLVVVAVQAAMEVQEPRHLTRLSKMVETEDLDYRVTSLEKLGFIQVAVAAV